MKKFKVKTVKKMFTKFSIISAISLSVLAGYSTQSIAASSAVEKVDYFGKNGLGNAFAVVQAPPGIHVDGITYVSYQGDLEDPYVASYNHETGEWNGPFQAGVSELGKDIENTPSGRKIDNHGKPTMIIDDLGYIHLFFGGHGGNGHPRDNKLGDVHSGSNKHVVSKNPYDISSWEELENISPYGSYNQALKMDNGDIYLFYRHGAHKSDWVYQKSTDHGRTFEKPVSFLKTNVLNDGFDSWYAFAKRGQGNDIIVSYDYHKCWKRAHNGDRGHTTERHNVYYMVFDTEKGTWKNVEGDKVKVPVTKKTADKKTLAIDTGDKWTFNGSVHLDADGNPHVGTSIGTDLGRLTGGPKQTRHFKWTGKEWVGGDPVNPQTKIDGVDTRGDFFIDDSTGDITFGIVYKEENNDGVAAYFTSTDNGETFTKSQELLRGSGTGYSISSMIGNAHPDARFMVAERRAGLDPVKLYLLGDNGPIQRAENEIEEEI